MPIDVFQCFHLVRVDKTTETSLCIIETSTWGGRAWQPRFWMTSTPTAAIRLYRQSPWCGAAQSTAKVSSSAKKNMTIKFQKDDVAFVIGLRTIYHIQPRKRATPSVARLVLREASNVMQTFVCLMCRLENVLCDAL